VVGLTCLPSPSSLCDFFPRWQNDCEHRLTTDVWRLCCLLGEALVRFPGVGTGGTFRVDCAGSADGFGTGLAGELRRGAVWSVCRGKLNECRRTGSGAVSRGEECAAQSSQEKRRFADLVIRVIEPCWKHSPIRRQQHTLSDS
jgi:hypothetical protein